MTNVPVTYVDFAAHVRSLFVMRTSPGTTASAELVAASDGAGAPGLEQFSLVFRAPADTPPVQRIYELEHPVLGDLELFLVPITRDVHGVYFEAVFSRPLSPALVED